ncbi:putative l-ascorbic acid binding protein [Venustampulla echinocandica]|uniref:Putative l-ascorbic acid binding protein n=1 Tax=Venustampulla echinocandica TaxID=2656787 RepID=A0A370TPT5_9HELO|nr:putative l-ascorbic acid binding protein [Venustampulla echinocandica]RDL37529.1 putative l-ascorbic acid binding protein [Venustampulla echinocandica]
MPLTQSLIRFEEAMEKVYGPFERIPGDTIAKWIPPPKSGGHKGRYLWTDAFGVVNFLTLHHETSCTRYLHLAKSLAENVHNILGWERDGKSRLPGATDKEPLKGGLRIGKVDATGTDGDGQYHHYLTLWMFALNRLSIATKDKEYNTKAITLAKAIHPHFVIKSGNTPRMVWKISSDMKKVLVPSEGHLDAATGYVVCRLLQDRDGSDTLKDEIADYKEVMEEEGKLTASKDPLDLGMALWMCHFFREEEWAADLGKKCISNSTMLLKERGGLFDRPPYSRLAFREFGTTLGVKCFSRDEYLDKRADDVVKFWGDEMTGATPEDLKPITLVMYAAALIPGGE